MARDNSRLAQSSSQGSTLADLGEPRQSIFGVQTKEQSQSNMTIDLARIAKEAQKKQSDEQARQDAVRKAAARQLRADSVRRAGEGGMPLKQALFGKAPDLSQEDPETVNDIVFNKLMRAKQERAEKTAGREFSGAFGSSLAKLFDAAAGVVKGGDFSVESRRKGRGIFNTSTEGQIEAYQNYLDEFAPDLGNITRSIEFDGANPIARAVGGVAGDLAPSLVVGMGVGNVVRGLPFMQQLLEGGKVAQRAGLLIENAALEMSAMGTFAFKDEKTFEQWSKEVIASPSIAIPMLMPAMRFQRLASTLAGGVADYFAGRAMGFDENEALINGLVGGFGSFMDASNVKALQQNMGKANFDQAVSSLRKVAGEEADAITAFMKANPNASPKTIRSIMQQSEQRVIGEARLLGLQPSKGRLGIEIPSAPPSAPLRTSIELPDGRSIPTPDGYVFHATDRAALDGISSKGLVPSEGKIFLAPDPDIARSAVSDKIADPLILRIRADRIADTVADTGLGGAKKVASNSPTFATTREIPTDAIEVLDNGAFRSLQAPDVNAGVARKSIFKERRLPGATGDESLPKRNLTPQDRLDLLARAKKAEAKGAEALPFDSKGTNAIKAANDAGIDLRRQALPEVFAAKLPDEPFDAPVRVGGIAPFKKEVLASMGEFGEKIGATQKKLLDLEKKISSLVDIKSRSFEVSSRANRLSRSKTKRAAFKEASMTGNLDIVREWAKAGNEDAKQLLKNYDTIRSIYDDIAETATIAQKAGKASGGRSSVSQTTRLAPKSKTAQRKGSAKEAVATPTTPHPHTLDSNLPQTAPERMIAKQSNSVNADTATRPPKNQTPQSTILPEETSTIRYEQSKSSLKNRKGNGGKGSITPKEKKTLLQRIGNSEIATRVQEVVQDSWVRVKKLYKRKGIEITDNSNPYMAEALFHGRIAERTELLQDTVRSIDDDLAKTAKSLSIEDTALRKDVNEFLIARHAPERNKVLGDGAAGMTNDEAKSIMKRITGSDSAKEVERIANQIQKLNDETLDILLEGELITKDLYDTLRARYKHHVPLQRILDDVSDAEEFVDVLTNKGMQVKGSGLKRAKGSDLEVDDVLTNVYANVQQALIRAEKNRVNLTTLNFAQKNMQTLGDLFEIVKPKPIGKTFDGKGMVFEQITDPLVLHVRKQGKPVYLRIADKKLATAFQGVNVEQVPSLLRGVAWLTRFYSGMATRFNPEFAFSNIVRDSQDLFVNMSADLGVKHSASALKKIPQNMTGIIDYMRGRDTELASLYKQMKLDGGTTGGLSLTTRGSIQLDVEKIIAENRSTPKKAFKTLVSTVDNFNQLFEDATRFGAYRSALEAGKSRKQAAMIAKNATVNFNKKGTAGTIINSLYMFSNASIQGAARTMKSLRDPKVAAGVFGTVGSTVYALNNWNDAVDPGWRDKLPPYEKNAHFVVVLSSGEEGIHYFKIPTSWGLRPIKVFMEELHDNATGRQTHTGKSIERFLSTTMEAYNPIGGSDVVSALVPSVLDFPVDIARNKAWHGGMIRPEWLSGLPADEQIFKSTPETVKGRIAIGTSKILKKIGLEQSPENLNYVYDQIVSGAGRAVTRFASTVAKPFTGDELQPKDTFVVNRFYGFRDNEGISKLMDRQEEEDFKSALKRETVEGRKELMFQYILDEGKDKWSDMAFKLRDIGFDTKGVTSSFGGTSAPNLYRYLKSRPKEEQEKYINSLDDDNKADYQKWAFADENPKPTAVQMKKALGLEKLPTNTQMYSHMRKAAILRGADPDTIPGKMPKGWIPSKGVSSGNTEKEIPGTDVRELLKDDISRLKKDERFKKLNREDQRKAIERLIQKRSQ